MIEINLIPDVKREYLRARAQRNYIIFMATIVGAAAIALAVVLGLVFSGQLVAEAVQNKSIEDQSKKLSAIEDLDKTVTIQQQLEKIDSQHSNKTIDSRLFTVLTAVNPPAPNDVRISTLKLDPETKTITMEGSALNGYAALEVLKKTIMNTTVQTNQDGQDVKIPLAERITSGDTGFGENAEGQRVLRFSFSFNYPSELFQHSKDPVSIVTPTGSTDVTDSRLGVPSSLFGKQPSDLPDDKEEDQS